MIIAIVLCTLLAIVCLGGAQKLAALIVLGFSFFMVALAISGVMAN